MALTNWRLVTAGTAVTGLALGALVGFSTDDEAVDEIDLMGDTERTIDDEDRRARTSLDRMIVSADSPDTTASVGQRTQTVDSPDGPAANTPTIRPDSPDSPDSPEPAPAPAPDSPDSPDSPAPARAAGPAPAPAPAPDSPDSPHSPAPVSADSPDS